MRTGLIRYDSKTGPIQAMHNYSKIPKKLNP